MITLTVGSRFVRIFGAPRSAIRRLEATASYRVAGFQFAPSFRAGRWDGKEHLLRHSARLGYHAPRGLTADFARTLRREGFPFRVKSEFGALEKRREFVWNAEIVPRDYQVEAVEAILSKPFRGNGVLKMPIRSGKTKTAALFVSRLGRSTLFIVPSKSLLYQTKEALEECFPFETIGIIGDGEADEQTITVASIQTLAAWRGKRGERKPDPRYKPLLDRFSVLIADEVHHFRGTGEWYKVLHDFHSPFKIGLSATAFLDSETEQERGIIWVKATCGPIRFDLPTSRLVEEGYLMKQNVRMLRVRRPLGLKSKKWSATLRDRAIVSNENRNRMIARAAKRYADAGEKIAIIVRFHEHINRIVEALEDEGIEFRVIVGRHSKDQRDDIVDGLVSGDYSTIVGTVLSEGVDIPAISVVINAEGGKDAKTTIQRQRNLTISEGKERAILIDFFDETNDILRKHSEERLSVYRSEPTFEVRVIG